MCGCVRSRRAVAVAHAQQVWDIRQFKDKCV